LDGRRAYVVVVTVLFILASFILGYMSPNLGSRSLTEGYVEPVRVAIGLEAPGYYSFKANARVEVEVRQGNETLYHEVRDNDPITLQWYRAIVTIIFHGYVWGITWLDTTGTARGMIETEYDGAPVNPVAYIQLGTDCTRATENDIRLGNPVYTVKPTLKYHHDIALATYRFVYTASVELGVSLTLCEVGLVLEVDVDTTSNVARAYLLVARDNIGPVTVPAGSTVTVTYLSIPCIGFTGGSQTYWVKHQHQHFQFHVLDS